MPPVRFRPIVARSETEAAELVSALMQPGFSRVDIMADHQVMAHSLATLGLDLVDEAVTMVRGSWPDTERVFAVASQAMG